MRVHPGNSQYGQLKLLVNPMVGFVQTCTQLVLNLGGPAGTYELMSNGVEAARGDFLTPALTGHLTDALGQLEESMGLRAPLKLPPSTKPVLAMRSAAALLTSSWLDRQGYEYKKAAVMLSELQPEGQRQAGLWDDADDEADRERSRRLMGVLDEVNARFGRGAVQLGALGTKPAWTMKRGRVSPRYTTRWADVPRVAG